MSDPFALPCHPERRLRPDDRAWRGIGVKNADDVRRQTTRCPDCTTSYTAFLRTFGAAQTVEWVRPSPFRVEAVPVEGGPLWQDAVEGAATGAVLPQDRQAVGGRGPGWERSVQLVTPAYVLSSGGDVVAEPGEVLLERRDKWNAQDRRLALLWAPRVQREVVVWHGFARLLQA